MYVLCRIAENIRKHFFSFFILLFQLVLVMAFLFYTVNLICSLNKKADNIRSEVTVSDNIIISAEGTDEHILFDDNKMCELNSAYAPDIILSHIYYYRFFVDFLEDSNKVFYVFFCDNDFISRSLGIDDSVLTSQDCIVGRNALSYISEYGGIQLDNININTDGEIRIADNKIKIKALENIEKTFSVSGDSLGAFYDIDISNCIFLSNEYDVRETRKAYEKLFVFFKSSILLETKIAICQEIVSYLESDSPVKYDFNSKLSKLNYEYVILQEEIDTYVFLSVLSVAIIIFALGGMKIIQLYHSKKRIAISIALGASPRMMIMEVTGDNIIIQLISVIFGSLLGTKLCSLFPNYLTSIQIYPISFLILFFTAFVSYVFTYIIMRKDFIQIKPIYVLK